MHTWLYEDEGSAWLQHTGSFLGGQQQTWDALQWETEAMRNITIYCILVWYTVTKSGHTLVGSLAPFRPLTTWTRNCSLSSNITITRTKTSFAQGKRKRSEQAMCRGTTPHTDQGGIGVIFLPNRITAGKGKGCNHFCKHNCTVPVLEGRWRCKNRGRAFGDR